MLRACEKWGGAIGGGGDHRASRDGERLSRPVMQTETIMARLNPRQEGEGVCVTWGRRKPEGTKNPKQP